MRKRSYARFKEKKFITQERELCNNIDHLVVHVLRLLAPARACCMEDTAGPYRGGRHQLHHSPCQDAAVAGPRTRASPPSTPLAGCVPSSGSYNDHLSPGTSRLEHAKGTASPPESLRKGLPLTEFDRICVIVTSAELYIVVADRAAFAAVGFSPTSEIDGGEYNI
jgi:hypothetical protein